MFEFEESFQNLPFYALACESEQILMRHMCVQTIELNFITWDEQWLALIEGRHLVKNNQTLSRRSPGQMCIPVLQMCEIIKSNCL